MLDRSEVGKRGYLDRDFRLVHLKDSLAQKIDYHYHEFDKLVIFLGTTWWRVSPISSSRGTSC